MARELGIFNFSANLEVKKEAALDARTVVSTKAELVNTDTWIDSDGKVWLYNGLVVAVVADETPTNNGLYFLINKDSYTDELSWIKVGSVDSTLTPEGLLQTIENTKEELTNTINDTKEELQTNIDAANNALNEFKAQTEQDFEDLRNEIETNITNLHIINSTVENNTAVLTHLNTLYPTAGTYALNRVFYQNGDATTNLVAVDCGTKAADGSWTFYLNKVIQNKTVNRLTYANTVTVASTGTVTVTGTNVVLDNNFIKDNNGVIQGKLTLTYDDEVLTDGSKAATINLRGLNDEVISSIDCTEFLKDGMLISVEYVGSENPEDESEGKLVFTWNVDATQTGGEGPTTTTTEVPLGKLFEDALAAAKTYTDNKDLTLRTELYGAEDTDGSNLTGEYASGVIPGLKTDMEQKITAEATAREEADTQLSNDLEAAKEEMGNQATENLEFSSDLNPDLAMLEDHGGLKTGTKISDLVGMTWKEIFEEILFPTIQPTASAPSATLSLKSTATTPTIQEVGTTGSTVPVASSFNTSFNRGQILILGKVQQANPERAGELIPGESFIYINGSASNTTFPTEIPDGAITYRYRAAYGEGNQPLDSKGNPATSISALPAGTVDSNIITINGVYPYFTNKASITTFAKLPLTTSTTLSAQEFVAEGPNKHAFKLPAKYTLTKVEMLNTLSGKYEDFGIDRWTVTTENIDVQGTSVSYKVYTRNDSGFNGSSTFNITFSKS